MTLYTEFNSYSSPDISPYSTSEYVPSDTSSSSSSDYESNGPECEANFEVNEIAKKNEDQMTNSANVGYTEQELELVTRRPYTKEILSRNQTSSYSVTTEQYIKKPSARERPTICPLCYQDVVTHFTRHLFRHHANNKEVQKIQNLEPKSKERLAMVASLRKQGYFHLFIEKDIMHPVRSSKNDKTVCTYCLGHYDKKILFKHVRHCKNRPIDVANPGKKCTSKSQTFMATMLSKNHEYLRSSRIKKEVFDIMRADDISAAAKNDPLICMYGETLLAKRKRQQIATVISNKMREMARMILAVKSINSDVRGMFDVPKPEMFRTLILAAKLISGYSEDDKNFKAPSLAVHMGTNLKTLCDVAYKLVLEKRKLPKLTWENKDEKRSEIKDLKKLIEGHWCNELSSIALKSLKERQWERPTKLPLSEDILKLQTYLHEQCEKAYNCLKNDIEISHNYKVLTECVLAQTVIFNRKRVGDVQYLQIKTYKKEDFNSNQNAFAESLTSVEKIISERFKRVVTGGKGSKPVPILFTRHTQKYIDCILKARENHSIVPKSNPYLFANAGSENRWMAGTNIIGRLAKNCGAKKPTLLTSMKFRKHIATTLQLMNMEPNEIEQIATFMGHTKKTHAEFYRLPQNIYQTAKVAKVLLLLDKGREKEFKGRSLNDIELEQSVYYSSESSDESEIEDDKKKPLAEKILTKQIKKNVFMESMEIGEENSSDEIEVGVHISGVNTYGFAVVFLSKFQ